MVNDMVDGARFIWRNRVFTFLIGLAYYHMFFGIAMSILFPVIAKDVLHVGPEVLGVMFAAMGAGSLVGVIIAAHFDTRPNSPGADDNASGVAAMVECARALTGRGLRRDVVLVAFDAEERQGQLHGLWGSEAFVRSLAGAASGNTHRRSAQDRPSIQVRAAFVLEMVGFSSQKGTQKIPLPMRALFPAAGWSVMRRGYAGDFLVAVTRGRGKIVARALARHSSRVGGPEVLTLGLPAWLPPPPDLLRSDHAPFWQAGVPAVMIGDTANFRNPNYHLPSDTPETLDYEMIAGVARALAETVSELSTER